MTPSIITLINQDADIRISHNFTEEEENPTENFTKEIQHKQINENSFNIAFREVNSSIEKNIYILNFPTLYYAPLSPPPELS